MPYVSEITHQLDAFSCAFIFLQMLCIYSTRPELTVKHRKQFYYYSTAKAHRPVELLMDQRNIV